MTGLLTAKEKLVGLYKNYEMIVKIIAKFILAFLAFSYVNSELGYLEALTGTTATLFLSVIGAIVPVAVLVLLFAVVVALHLYKLSMIFAIMALVVFAFFYLVYLKFAPDQGVLIILFPVLAQFNLHYMIPLVGAMAFNPFAAVPVAFGVIFTKVLEYLKEAAALGDPGTDVQGIMTSIQYVFDKLIADPTMIAYVAIFTAVIVVVYAISRLSVNYAWYIAIAAGTIINVAGLAVMTSGAEGVSIGMVVAGSVLGGIIAALIQFMGCTLDYARKEYLQFEDDDYYYYVKAVPKIQVTEEERKVKRFGNKEDKPKKEKKAKKDKKGKKDKTNVNEVSNETEIEETVIRHFDDQPTVGETRIFDAVKPAEPKATVSDFDELSFEGFDFDNLN